MGQGTPAAERGARGRDQLNFISDGAGAAINLQRAGEDIIKGVLRLLSPVQSSAEPTAVLK